MQKNKHKLLYTILGVILSISCLLCGVTLTRRTEVYAQNQVVSSEADSLPVSYSLFDIEGIDVVQSEHLPYRVGNQRGAGICWAFGTLTAFETTLRMTNVIDRNLELNFSEADVAYYAYVEARSMINVGGGAFEFAYEYLTRGKGVAKEKDWETSNEKNWASNSTLTQFYGSQIETNTRTYLPYEAKECINFPSRAALKFNNNADNIDEETTEQNVLELRNRIKKHITTYGAVAASIYMNTGAYYDNVKNTFFNNGTTSTNHLITIVGWDDNIEDNQGNIGAYICQNSYGTGFGKDGFFYVMYNDNTIENNVSGFIRVGKMENEEDIIVYDKMDVKGAVNKNQFCVFSGTNYSISFIETQTKSIFANVFEREIYENQYVSKIKVPAVSTVMGRYNSDKQLVYYRTNNPASNFNIYIASGISKSDLNSLSATLASKFAQSTKVKNSNVSEDKEYQFTSQQTGFYYIDLNDEIELTGDYFAVFMQVDKGSSIFAGDNSKNISYPTYTTTNASGTSGWGEYKLGAGSSSEYVSVLPMVVESKIKGEIDFSVENKNIIAEYDGKAHNPAVSVQTPTGANVMYSVDGGEFVSDINLVDVKWGLDSNGKEVAVPYTIVVKVSAKFYDSKTMTCHVQINPKTLTITPTERTITYGDADNQTLTFSSEGLVNGEDLYYTGRLQRQPGTNVGQYAITMGDFKLAKRDTFNPSNYTLVFDETKMFTIEPKTLSVSVGTNRKYYGESDPELTYKITGAANGEVPKGEFHFERPTGENVGNYRYSLMSNSKLIDNPDTGFYASNYTFKITSGSILRINKRVVTLKFDKQLSKTVGEADPEFLFTLENVLLGEEAKYTGTLSREEGESVGHYRILAGTFAFEDGTDGKFLAYNYKFELEEAYFYITNGTLDAYSYVSNKTTTYDATEHYVDIFANESMSVRYCIGEEYVEEESSSDPIGRIHVGKTTLTIRFSMKDYNDSYATVYIEILPATLYVTPKSGQGMAYGDKDYTINFTYSGNFSGETPNFEGKLAKAEGTDVGTYDILFGTLQLADSDTFQKNDYQIELSGEVKFLVLRRELKIVPAKNISKNYGKTDPEFPFVLSGVVEGDNVTYLGKLSRKPGESVGLYKFTIGSVTLTDEWTKNYKILDEIDDSFIIFEAIINIRLLDMTAVYGELDLNFQYEFLDGTENNFASSDNVKSVIEFICNDANGKPISNTTRKNSTGYTISARSKNPNYIVNAINGTYTITYRTCTITFKYLNQMETQQVMQFEKIETPTINTNVAGYTFVGWQIGSETVDISAYAVTSDVTFVGGYKLNTYTITYNSANGEMPAEYRRTFDVTTETFYLPIPTRSRYYFKGWFDNSSFVGTAIEKVEQGTAENLTLYAKWRGENCTITPPAENEKFAIQGSGNAEYGTNRTFYVVLQSGYSKARFDLKVYINWADGDREQVYYLQDSYSSAGLNPGDDQITYLQYSVYVRDSFEVEVQNVNMNVYKIEYIVGNKRFTTRELQHGLDMPEELIPEIPEKEHYTQTPPVWDEPTIKNIQSDKIIHAIYTPDVYKVTFKFEDGQTVTEDVTYGTICSTDKLNEIYELKFMEYFEFDVPLDDITEDTIINVKIVSNRKILYIVLGVVAGLAIIGTVVGIFVRKRKHRFNWWSYNK